jgi:hypothetical protein
MGLSVLRRAVHSDRGLRHLCIHGYVCSRPADVQSSPLVAKAFPTSAVTTPKWFTIGRPNRVGHWHTEAGRT